MTATGVLPSPLVYCRLHWCIAISTGVYYTEAPEDYISTSGTLTFQTGDTRRCYPVQIVDDEFCDPGLFLTNIALITGEPVITVEPNVAEIDIMDPDCGEVWSLSHFFSS